MPEFITTLEAPETTEPQIKTFKQQTTEERYRGLVERLHAKVNQWTIWADDLRVAAAVEEGLGNRGKANGLYTKAKTIDQCKNAILPYIERHMRAINE